MQSLRPPITLSSKAFGRTYANKLEVLEAADLSVQPLPDAPCINVVALTSPSAIFSGLVTAINNNPNYNDQKEHENCSMVASKNQYGTPNYDEEDCQLSVQLLPFMELEAERNSSHTDSIHRIVENPVAINDQYTSIDGQNIEYNFTDLNKDLTNEK